MPINTLTATWCIAIPAISITPVDGAALPSALLQKSINLSLKFNVVNGLKWFEKLPNKKVRPFFAFAIFIVLVFNLTACTSIKDYAYQDYSVKSMSIDKEAEIEKLFTAISSLKNEDGLKFSFDTCAALTNCQFERNRIFARLVASSDAMCIAHLKTLHGNEASSNFILGSLTTIFTTLSAGAGRMVAKTNLAAIGAISSAERSLINDTVYKGALVPAIHQKILEVRHAKRDGFNGIYNADYVSYPMERAVADAIDYHYTCSFMLGLQLALREGTTNTHLLQLRAQVADAESKLTLAMSAYPGIAAQNNPVIEKNRVRFTTLSDALLKAELTAAKVAPEVAALQPLATMLPVTTTPPPKP